MPLPVRNPSLTLVRLRPSLLRWFEISQIRRRLVFADRHQRAHSFLVTARLVINSVLLGALHGEHLRDRPWSRLALVMQMLRCNLNCTKIARSLYAGGAGYNLWLWFEHRLNITTVRLNDGQKTVSPVINFRGQIRFGGQLCAHDPVLQRAIRVRTGPPSTRKNPPGIVIMLTPGRALAGPRSSPCRCIRSCRPRRIWTSFASECPAPWFRRRDRPSYPAQGQRTPSRPPRSSGRH
jgi:hypothetical protein